MTSCTIDHLVYAAPTLASGIETIASQLGARAVMGGRHLNWGTRNALLGLEGARSYLEILAPDPDTPPPPGPRPFGADVPQPRMTTWAVATNDPHRLARRIAEAGVDLGDTGAGSRRTEDGLELSWRLSDPYTERLGGVIPFLIDWGTTPHPSATVPPAGRLVELRISFPDPHRVHRVLDLLELRERIVVDTAPASIMAIIDTPRGRVILR